MQAVAIQDEENIVGVYAGMFWMLCRMAAAVSNSGAFPSMNGIADSNWQPVAKQLNQVLRDLLEEETPFGWAVESIGWREKPERQFLFYFVLSLSFRFVVLHELGHVMNDHAKRKKSLGNDALLIDRVGPTLVEPEEAMRSQAREIIADSYALLKTIETFKSELLIGMHLELAKVVQKNLTPDGPALINFTLSVIYLYFRLSDRSNWQASPVDQLTHPPAPFRMKALFSLVLDSMPLGIDGEIAKTIVRKSILTGDALASVVFNILPQPNWFNQISTPEYDEHFKHLYEEFPNWSGILSHN